MTTTREVHSIDDVVTRLTQIIAWAEHERSPVGYFAGLYRRVTQTVRDHIHDGLFDDPERVEQLDVVFASRYLDAFDAWRAGAEPSHAWGEAMFWTKRWSPIVLQHLLGGMNAHINLDLGIAVATVAPGDALATLAGDFAKMAGVLAGLVAEVKAELESIWPALQIIDRLSGTADDVIVNFSMSKARDEAWAFAEQLAPLARDQWAPVIERRDRVVSALAATLVYRPGLLTSAVLLGVRLTERGDMPTKLAALARPSP